MAFSKLKGRLPILHLLFVLAIVYALSSFVLFQELDTSDSSEQPSFSVKTLVRKVKVSHKRIAKLVRRDLVRSIFPHTRVEASCSPDFGCILPRPQLYFASTDFAVPGGDDNLPPKEVPKFHTKIDFSALARSSREKAGDHHHQRPQQEEVGEEDKPGEEARGPKQESTQERRLRERRERRERERVERERDREARRREREAVREAVKQREAEESLKRGDDDTPVAEHKEPYKLSQKVQGELHNSARIEKLLNTKVDVVMNQLNLEMRGKISCGGHPVMEFHDVDAVLASHPQLEEVIPEQDEIGVSRLGKCAVVGNSGSLLGKEHGSEIDAHDAVFRFNGAPTAKFEKDVGTKTTVRIQNVDNLGFKESSDRYLIFTARNKGDLRKFVNHRKRYRKRKQYTFNPEFWCHIWDWVSHRKLKPSTGLAGIVMALKTCDHPINMYGFHHNDTNFHYFNHLPDKVTTQDVYRYHPLLEEAEIYKELETESLANIVS